jgi:hypothetical protein
MMDLKPRLLKSLVSFLGLVSITKEDLSHFIFFASELSLYKGGIQNASNSKNPESPQEQAHD